MDRDRNRDTDRCAGRDMDTETNMYMQRDKEEIYANGSDTPRKFVLFPGV
jgi:hypothetical protein